MGIHAFDMVDNCTTPAGVADQERLGIAGAAPINVRAEFLADGAMVVNFAVGHNDVAGGRVHHRLGAGRRKIDDGEPGIAEPVTAAGGTPVAPRIRSTMT